MKTRNRTLGVTGLVVAFVAMLAASGCDPYLQPNKNAPEVIGVIAVDIAYNGQAPDTVGCTAPYPQVMQSWADINYPGTCVPGGYATVCPVMCYPPRTGPAFAPYYQGTMGASYQTDTGASYTYAIPSSWVLSNVPPYVEYTGVAVYDYSMIKVMFNKVMLPQSIETVPFGGVPPSTLAIYQQGVTAPVTSQFNFHYNPSNEVTFWGGAMEVTAIAGLPSNTTYTIQGTVQDQDGNSLPINITFSTAVPLIDPANP